MGRLSSSRLAQIVATTPPLKTPQHNQTQHNQTTNSGPHLLSTIDGWVAGEDRPGGDAGHRKRLGELRTALAAEIGKL